jgi:hypothetical protein
MHEASLFFGGAEAEFLGTGCAGLLSPNTEDGEMVNLFSRVEHAEAAGGHNGPVVLVMGGAEVGWHGKKQRGAS